MIEGYPTGQTYQPVVGELWTTTPKSVKVYDIHDIPESLASKNANGDISGELVNVGQGTAQDFEGKDLKGKFVHRWLPMAKNRGEPYTTPPTAVVLQNSCASPHRW